MKIYLETYGCTANKSDERLLVGLLTQKGHELVQTMEQADVLVLLTCTVIDTTEQRMLSRLKVFQKTHKKIIVTGCMPTVQADRITATVPDAYLLPCRSIPCINDIIFGNKTDLRETKKTMLPKQYDTVMAPVLIAEGCRFSCSYCITRFARGALRSFPLQDIVSDVNCALKQGCKEIQLTAQDTASYGLDIGTDLGALLTHLRDLKGTFRIRVGMMNPAALKKNLDSILTAYQHHAIYQFLHLPVQSGDDDILKKMKRGYTTKDFISLVEQFRKKIPTLTLATDVIVGFPTETQEQFKKTMQLIEDVQPDIVNITRFSARPLTTAKTMKGRIPTFIVKQRSKQITKQVAKLTLEKNTQHLGSTHWVLVTEKGKHNTFTGRTESYKQVVFKQPVVIGDVVQARIIDAAPTYIVGKLI